MIDSNPNFPDFVHDRTSPRIDFYSNPTPPIFLRWSITFLISSELLREPDLCPEFLLQVDFIRAPTTNGLLQTPTTNGLLRASITSDLLQISTTRGPRQISTVSLHPSFYCERIPSGLLSQAGFSRASSINDPHPDFYENQTPIKLL